MSNLMENLINNKFYKNKEDVTKKLNVFFAFNAITEQEYASLMELTESKYVEVTTQ